MRKSILAFAAAAVFAHTALAWNSTGHEAVAAIAWDNMKPATRVKAMQILRGAQDGDCLKPLDQGNDREFFIHAATWPDLVRPARKGDPPNPCAERFHRETWHFFDHFWSGTSGGATTDETNFQEPVKPDEKEPSNSVARLTAFSPDVACNGSAKCKVVPAHAHELACILHLVGDVHQPLHNAAHVVTVNGQKVGDRGGNFFKFAQGTKPSNLHSYWDDIVGESVDIAFIDKLIKQIQKDHPRATLASRLESQQFGAWSSEGLATAKAIAYPSSLKADDGLPSPAYHQTVFNAADEAIALAGYRLADLLDQLFA